MSSFTVEQLCTVARVYARYVGVKVHRINNAERCPGTKRGRQRFWAHTHWRDDSFFVGTRSRRIVRVKKGTICFGARALKLPRRDQIQLLIHELHHLRRTKKALSHRSNLFQDEAEAWAYGTSWGFANVGSREAQDAKFQAKKDIETATEIIETERPIDY